jgi:hypothetical protein
LKKAIHFNIYFEKFSGGKRQIDTKQADKNGSEIAKCNLHIILINSGGGY